MNILRLSFLRFRFLRAARAWVIAALVFLLTTAGAAPKPLSGSFYIYQGKRVELGVDAARVAVRAPTTAGLSGPAREQAGQLAERLASLDLKPEAVRAHGANGWFLVDVRSISASTARARLGKTGGTALAAPAELARLRVASVLSALGSQGEIFVSPVLLAGDKSPMIVTPSILVGFRKGVAPPAARGEITREQSGKLEPEALPGYVPDTSARFRSRSQNGFDVLDQANQLATDKRVEFAEPDFLVTGSASLVPNDPLFGDSWALSNTGQQGGLAGFDLGAVRAWDITTGSSSVIVAVLDSGVDQSHPDLNQVTGKDFTTDSPSNPNGNPVGQYDNHGTTVAGCISGRLNNGIGAAGIAPGVRVFSARIATNYNDRGEFSLQFSWVADALFYARSIGARVSNNSNYLSATSSAIDNAYVSTRNNGMVHFASSGNSGAGSISYPANATGVNAVGAVDRFGRRADFSQYGTGLAFVAPGVSVLTTDRGGGLGYGPGDYVTVQGTSYASPYAAGVAALLLSQTPSMTPAQVEDRLRATAIDIGAAGYDQFTGAGLVNAAAALGAGGGGPPQRPPNDDFASASLLNFFNARATATGTNVNATIQSGEVTQVDSVAFGQTVWWRFSGVPNGQARVSTAGSAFDTVVAVYRGDSLNPPTITRVAFNDDSSVGGTTTSLATFNVDSAGFYWVQVGGFSGSSGIAQGSISLSVDLIGTGAPGNDSFGAATFLSGTVPNGAGTNRNATREGGEPFHAGNSGGASVWWRWTAPSAGQVTVSTDGSDFDTILGVYTGSAVGGLATIASDDDSGAGLQSYLVFNAVAGQTYSIAVDGYGGSTGNIQLALRLLGNRPSNDDFLSRPTLATSATASSRAFGSNANATKEPGEPLHAENSGGASVWWNYNATRTGRVTVSTQGSNFDTTLAIYSGSSVGSLAALASDDDALGVAGPSRLVFNAVAGSSYAIAVDGYRLSSGSPAAGNIVLTVAPTPQKTDFTADDRPDLLWHNTSTGEVQVWRMNGTSPSGNNFRAAVLDPATGWRIICAADFNGDGQVDLLWRNINADDGRVVIWTMNGTTPTGVSYFVGQVRYDSGWDVVGAADFTGDGRPDLLWRNRLSGDIVIWEMNGVVHSGNSFYVGNVSVDWNIVGTADFTGDGSADFLWQNSNTGAIVIWEMFGVRPSGVSWSPGRLDPATGWKIAGAGDFTGDGRPDLLWRNTSGAVVIWEMFGVSPSGTSFFLNGPPTSTGWELRNR